jgi:pseudouridine synthase
MQDNDERLQKVLARAGIASRRASEELILAGRVKVNGKVVRQLGTKINPAKDKVSVDDQPIAIKAGATPELIYFALHKPTGYLSTVSDPQGRPTIMDLVDIQGRIYPIGRLDVDTAGLILLTNDGAFANALMHPTHGIEKEYLVLIEGIIPLRKLEDLRKGVVIPVEDVATGERNDYKTKPAKVEFLRHEGSNTLIKVVLTEGKKRQVRLMAQAIATKVVSLTRVRFGTLKLGDLAEGKYRKLSKLEVKSLLLDSKKPPTEPKETFNRQSGKIFPPKTEQGFKRPTNKPVQTGTEQAVHGRPAKPSHATPVTPGKSPPPKPYPAKAEPAARGRADKPAGGKTGKNYKKNDYPPPPPLTPKKPFRQGTGGGKPVGQRFKKK